MCDLSLYETDDELCNECKSNQLTYERESNIIVCKRCNTIQ